MTDKTQPEALRLALSISLMDTFTNYQQEELDKAAAELRRQHARIVELEAQLESIGAGGVSGPLMGQPQEMPDLSALTERGAKAWAGVDAQGLREGVASAGSEPVARVNDDGFIVEIGDLPIAPGQKLYLHPSPQEGMVMVPKEPTPEMIEAGRWAEYGESSYRMCNVSDSAVIGVWESMIAAAPPTTSAGSGKGE